MVLPERVEDQFEQTLITYEEEKMQYISTIERRALERGLEQGLEQGALKGVCQAIIEVLETRFETVPQIITERINAIEDLPSLKRLLKQAVTINSLADFQQALAAGQPADSPAHSEASTNIHPLE
jgi:hypothetical protein